MTLAIVLLATAAPAYAQERTPTPSAQELWRDYPLRQRDVAAPERTAGPSPVRSASGPAAPDPSGSSPALVAILAVAAFAASATAVLLVRRRRSRSFAVPLAATPRLALVGPPAGSDRILFSRPAPDRSQRATRKPASEPRGVPPPDPDSRWTAEIQWARSGDTARFSVAARDEQGTSEPVIARSEPFDWPPAGTEAVQALVAAADALAEALTIAGWKPLPRGEGWYAKRFEWEPAPVTEWAPPRPPTHRFRPADESEGLWRCAITWHRGYARSRFEVVMHDPTAAVADRVIAASPPFKWLFMGDPDPGDVTFREAALDLAAALEAAGWERVGVGAAWYAARFVWRGDEPPPDEIPLADAERREAS